VTAISNPIITVIQPANSIIHRVIIISFALYVPSSNFGLWKLFPLAHGKIYPEMPGIFRRQIQFLNNLVMNFLNEFLIENLRTFLLLRFNFLGKK